jgi:hypothetical protein
VVVLRQCRFSGLGFVVGGWVFVLPEGERVGETHFWWNLVEQKWVFWRLLRLGSGV